MSQNVNLAGLESVAEEILGKEDLVKLLENDQKLNHYIGLEISGLVHLGTGMMSGLVIRELQKLGVNTSYFLADWHTWINDKLNSDMVFIKEVAEGYFGPALKVSAQIVGADSDKIQMNYGTSVYHNNDRYWQTVVEVSKNLTLSRVLKSTTILGRQESDIMKFAYLIYPAMQVADIYEMECHIAHAGLDQRKCHVIAREVSNALTIHPLKDSEGKKMSPIAIHHALVSGLQKPTTEVPEGASKEDLVASQKMSKSVPGSAIFIHDSPEEIKDKILKAYAPPKVAESNPILNWVEHLILPVIGELTVKREDKFGGTFKVKSINELTERYASGDLFPLDLKNSVAEVLTDILKPARDFFADKEHQDLIQKIRDVKKTR